MPDKKNLAPIAAIVISVATLVMTALSLQSRAKVEYVRGIEGRLAQVENDLRMCITELLERDSEILSLQRENVRLMRILTDRTP